MYSLLHTNSNNCRYSREEKFGTSFLFLYQLHHFCIYRCLARPTTFQLPSHLQVKKSKGKKSGTRQRIYTYDRDIICLPRSQLGKDGLVRISRKKSLRDYLAMNKLVGKIRLTSDMNERAIFQEIRSVFENPMAGKFMFPFKVLQTCGGASKTLSSPVLSSSFKWTASAIAGRNAKVPIYILAQDDLIVSNESLGFIV